MIDMKPVVLRGEAGVGKTWFAREIAKEIPEHVGEADKQIFVKGTLWLSLEKRYQDGVDKTLSKSLLEDLARQLCVLPPIEGGFEEGESDLEEDDDKDDKDEFSEKPKTPSEILNRKRSEELKRLEKLVLEKLDRMTIVVTDGKKENKCVLLVLDGAWDNLDVKKEIIAKIEPLKSLMTDESGQRLTVLVTANGGDILVTGGGVDDLKIPQFEAVEISTLEKPHFLALLSQIAEKEKLSKENDPVAEISRRAFSNGGRGGGTLPAAAASLIVKAFKHSYEDRVGVGLADLETCLKGEETPAVAVARFAFDALTKSKKKKAAAVECCWHSRKFFSVARNFSVHYNELIANWILEGYFDHELLTHSVEKAYSEGYEVFTELVHRGILKVEEHDDYVSMDSLAMAVADHRLSGFDRKAHLGLPDVFMKKDGDWSGFGRIAVSDGMVRSICRPGKRLEVSTMFVDGERLVREVPKEFFDHFKGTLTTLVVTNPRLRSLEFLRDLKELKMLVLRGCDVLDDANAVEVLEKLIVLEISGARSLRRLGEVFSNMPHLRSLNLAGSRLENIPSSFLKLKRVRWLVLRGCTALEEMPSLQHLAELEVVDVSGISSLRNIKGKNFGELEKLRSLDFSQSHIAPLPFVNSLKSLTRLTLKGCDELTRLPHLDHLGGLQVLQVRGAKKLREFYNYFLENKESLRILDLSGSQISVLPRSFNDLPKLERLDLSDMKILKEFEKVNLDRFTSLQTLNLSNTGVKTLPSLSKLGSLCELLLSDCGQLETLPAMKELTSLEVIDLTRASELKELPEQALKDSALREIRLGDCKKLAKLPTLTGLAKLEVMDLSGCEALEGAEIEKQPFNEMSSLQSLDLSRTKIQKLKALSSTRLRQLSLENCVKLDEIPELGSLSSLDRLNLSGAESLSSSEAMKLQGTTNLVSLNLSRTSMTISSSYLAQCTKLKELSLSGCKITDSPVQLEKLTCLETLDLSKASFTPRAETKDSEQDLGLTSLSNLKSLNLSGCELKTFPNWISSLNHLESLRLPELTQFKEFDWTKIKRLPDNLNWTECKILEIPIPSPSTKISFSVNGTKIFEALKKYPKIWKENFEKFRIYVCPLIETGKDDVYRMREKQFYENIYLQTISCPGSCKRFLEIRGFEKLPEGLDEATLEGVDCLSFIDNDFFKSLSDLRVGNLKAMTGLWVERCAVAESIFSGEKAIVVGEDFSFLWASNLPMLKSLFNERDRSFENLTQLYLDCCPMIEYVFSSSQLPEKLEKLEAKFCHNLKALVECETSSSSSSSSVELRELPKLRELYLLELPELISVGVKLPSLKKGKVKCCPNLSKLGFCGEIRDVDDMWEGASVWSPKK